MPNILLRLFVDVLQAMGSVMSLNHLNMPISTSVFAYSGLYDPPIYLPPTPSMSLTVVRVALECKDVIDLYARFSDALWAIRVDV